MGFAGSLKEIEVKIEHLREKADIITTKGRVIQNRYMGTDKL